MITFQVLKKYHWVFNWSGNWPTLDSTMENDAAYRREMTKISGTYIRTWINIGHHGSSTNYVAEEELERLEKFFKTKFSKNSKFLTRSALPYRRRVNADLVALKKIYRSKNLRNLSNHNLATLFSAGRKHLSYNGMMDIYDSHMERIFTPLLEEYLHANVPLPHITEFVNVLVAPHKKSVIYKERRMLFSIVRFIRRFSRLRSRVRRNRSIKTMGSETLHKKIEEFLEKYQWMPVLVNYPPRTKQDVYKEIRHLVVTDAPLKIKAKRLGDDFDRKIINKSKKYLKELDPPPHIRDLIEGLRAMAFLRTEDYAVLSQSSFYLRPLYTEAARRLGLTYYELKEFLPEEIVAALKNNQKISKRELAKRLRLSCHARIGSQAQLYTGRQAQAIQRLMESKPKLATKKVLHGTVGNAGIIRGKARVVFNPAEARQVKKGEILVGAFFSSATTPSLRKAAALVTEFGGLTSHPVIVAREFNIPCLVGVKHITKLLKTGQRVEVDANTGVIKVL